MAVQLSPICTFSSASALGALLYFWLIGHWFARVLVFLVFGVIIGCIGFGVASSVQFEQPKQATTTKIPECVGQADPFCLALQPAPREPAVADRQSTEKEQAVAAVKAPEKQRAIVALPTFATSPMLQIIGVLLGVALAWPVSSIPVNLRRYKIMARERNV